MTIADAQKLKGLQSKLNKLRCERGNVQSDIITMQRKIGNIDENISDIVTDIEDLKEKPTIVTEHAILRFIQYKYGINMDEVIKQIITPEVIEQINGDGKYYSHDGFTRVVKNNSIVTVLDR